MKGILIDTRIWVLALKFPFLSADDNEFELGKIASKWFVPKFNDSNTRILVSTQLISEIYHVLTKRGRKISSMQAMSIMNGILERKNVLYRPISKETISKAIAESQKSGIHIWDYLVILPFMKEIQRIYTMDPHIRDKSFQKIAMVENPIGIWSVEG